MRVELSIKPLIVLVAILVPKFVVAQEENQRSLIVAPPALGERKALYVMPSRNLIVGGACAAYHVFRLDNLRPIRAHLEAGCHPFFVGEKTGVIIKSFKNGVTLNTLESDEQTAIKDHKGFPGFLHAGALINDETELVATSVFKPDVYRVRLSGNSRWEKIGSHRPGDDVAAFATASAGSVGLSLAETSGKPSHVILWDFGAGRKIASYEAETATISQDGRLFALAVKTGKDQFRLEVRRFPEGQLLSDVSISNLAHRGYGTDLSNGSFVFLPGNGSLAFVTDIEGSTDNLELRVWDFARRDVQARGRFSASYGEDVISIHPGSKSLYLLRANGVHRFSIDPWMLAVESPSLETFEPKAASMSGDSKVVVLSEQRKLVAIDTGTGAVERVVDLPANAACDDSCNITHLAFIPGAQILLAADDSGAITSVDMSTSVSSPVLVSRGGKRQSFDGLAVSSNGKFLAFVQNDTAKVARTSDGEVFASFAVSDLSRSLAFVDDDRRLLVAGMTTQAFDLSQRTKVLDFRALMFITKTKYFGSIANYIARTDLYNGAWMVGVYGSPGGQLLAYRQGRIVKHVGEGRPGFSFKAGQGQVAIGYDENQMIIGKNNELRSTDQTFFRWERIASHASDIMFLGKLSSGNLLSISKNGEIRIGKQDTSTDLVRTTVYSNGNWISVTPDGFFAGTEPAMRGLYVRAGEAGVLPLDGLYQALYRPDLVRESISGDPKGGVRDAARKLDLRKVIASGAPPRVSFITKGGQMESDDVIVEASIAEQNGGGIGKIEWRINGITLGVESRGVKRLPEGQVDGVGSNTSLVVTRKLALEPGENNVELVVYNAKDLVASDPAKLILTWDGRGNATPPRLHVLAVGVNNYYDSRLRLSHAVSDAKAIGDAMRMAGGSMYASVEVTSVLDDQVTTNNLDKIFADISDKVHPRDVFMFFLAGHGKTVDGRYHFLPHDFRYESEESIVKRGIDQDRFQSWFARIPARKSILLYDTCESGSLTGDRVAQRGVERVAALEKLTRAMGRTVLSASTDDTPALEGYRGHGVFTYALLAGMEAADTNSNGLIEVTEIANYIDEQVPDLSYQAFKLRQIPQMRIVGSSFPVVNRMAVLPPVINQGAAISVRPTHVVISQVPVEVYAMAARGGSVVQSLPPGSLVTSVDAAGGWLLIAKDGRKIGYIDEKALTRLQ